MFSTTIAAFVCGFVTDILFFTKNQISQNRLNETIVVLNKIDTNMRKNITLFHESKMMSSSRSK